MVYLISITMKYDLSETVLYVKFMMLYQTLNFLFFYSRPLDYTEENLARALEYQKSLEADMGGTELYEPLKATFQTPLSGEGWYRQIILITDGQVCNVDEVMSLDC